MLEHKADVSKQVQSAGPAMPVAVLGLADAPNAGDDLLAVESERKAREVALYRQGKFKDVQLARQQAAKLSDVFEQLKEDEEAKTLNLIIADIQTIIITVGSLADHLGSHALFNHHRLS
mgnify:CR=1 FL=1